MNAKTALVIFLYLGMTQVGVQATEEDSAHSRSELLSIQVNKRLEGHVVQQFESPTFMSCSHYCLKNAWCTSTNFKQPSEKNGKGTCELNKHGGIDENSKLHDEQGVSFSARKRTVLYHQTMTPSWLKAHASYIDSHHTKTTEQLTFNAGSTGHAALLKVPMIAAGFVKHGAPLTVKIVVSHDISIGSKKDSDISYGVSDGINFVGFIMIDKQNYPTSAPCYRYEGISGVNLSGIQFSGYNSKPTDSFYPSQFVITLKLFEQWGSCYTAHDGGFLKTTVYNNRLMPGKGIIVEVYKENKGEKVGIKSIEVTIMQNL